MAENKTQTKAEAHNKILREWKTPEFVSHERGKMWYVVAGALMISLIAYAIFTGSATMAIVFILIAGMYYLTHNQIPRMIDIRITELGIWVDKNYYAYNTINGFWVVFHPSHTNTLYFNTGERSQNTIRVELYDQNPVEVRHLLAREIPEVEGKQESFYDLLIRLLSLQ